MRCSESGHRVTLVIVASRGPGHWAWVVDMAAPHAMKLDPNSPEYAKHVVGVHARGTVCAGEVWIQFCDFFTPETLPVWLESLTPELDRYFRRMASDADFEHCRCERERSGLQSIIDWYAQHPAA